MAGLEPVKATFPGTVDAFASSAPAGAPAADLVASSFGFVLSDCSLVPPPQLDKSMTDVTAVLIHSFFIFSLASLWARPKARHTKTINGRLRLLRRLCANGSTRPE